MEPNSRAEELPSLYRAILDRVAELEAAGHRKEAARVRSEATTAYSRAWDDRARRELGSLLRRAERPTATERLRGRGQRDDVDRGLARSGSRTVVSPDA
jgi:hypothetical protein